MRKRLAILLALSLTAIMSFGIIGSGAVFQWSGTVDQTIAVGDFGCALSSTTDHAVVTANSVSLTSPTIMSSAAGTAPLDFTVTATGSIPVKVHVTQTSLGAPFSSMLASPIADVNLVKDGSHTYNAGIQWAELGNADLSKTASITYNVTCNEQAPVTPLIHYVFKSTNADNIAGTVPGHPGTIGPNVVAVDNGNGSITLSFTAGTLPGHYVDCFEYVTNGNVPQQSTGVNPNSGTTDGDPIVLDGYFPHTCLFTPGTAPQNVVPQTDTVTLSVGHGGYVQVRMVFGAESDFRFDWTQFDAS